MAAHAIEGQPLAHPTMTRRSILEPVAQGFVQKRLLCQPYEKRTRYPAWHPHQTSWLLGFWLPVPALAPLHAGWTSYFSLSSQRLFQPNPQRPSHYKQLSTGTRLALSLALYNPRLVQQSIHAASPLLSDAVPVQPTLSGYQLQVNSPHTPTILEPEPAPSID